ncbi:MAG: DegV family protein [Clostridia bacterium]|nr:DegV family protein [Clostridia bacterium]
MSVRIIIDSTADVAANLRARFTILPLTLRFGEEEYKDGVDITSQEFYEKLVESDVMPSTSQATPYQFTEVFREAVDAGDTVVALTISSRLSGTWQSAMMAAEDFFGKVFVVDSRSVAIGSGILAEYALELVDQGLEAKEIADRLTVERENVHLLAMVNTLEYLKRGGRVSKSVAFAGELLSIKPVIAVRDGEVSIIGKARGSRAANNLLVKEIENAGGVDFFKPVMLGYTGMSDAMLQKYIRDSAALWEGHLEELRTTIVGSVIGTHAGPGAVAVAFFCR